MLFLTSENEFFKDFAEEKTITFSLNDTTNFNLYPTSLQISNGHFSLNSLQLLGQLGKAVKLVVSSNAIVNLIYDSSGEVAYYDSSSYKLEIVI